MKKEKNLAPGIAIVMVLMLATAAALLATPVLADPPQKYVASLYENCARYGQAIFNTNLEDGDCFELEVEVEECMALADRTVTVYLGTANPTGTEVGTIYVNALGNGKATFCVDDISTSDIIRVVETNSNCGNENAAFELTSGSWRDWVQGKKGPK